MILVTGPKGVLGSALCRDRRCEAWHVLLEEPYYQSLRLVTVDAAILCAGRKGFYECDGNDDVFRADVDGNISLAKQLMHHGVFVVFLSTEAVERTGHRAAYSSNRLLVEQFLWTQENNAIIRPRRFDSVNVGGLADLCIKVATEKLSGIHYWP